MSADFADPRTNLMQLGLRDGMKVGDFGAGSGHYTINALRLMGNDSRVYAVDVQEDVLAHIRAMADRTHLRNIETIWGNIEKLGGTKLRDHVLDVAIISNVLFQLGNPANAVKEIARTLKPGGKVMVIDWAGSYGGMGPSNQHVVSEQKADELFIGANFHKEKAFRAGPHHYGLIFTAP